MLPIQRSTPAEGSVGGVGGRIHDNLEAAGRGDDEQGPLFRPIRNNRTGRIDKALVAEGRHRGAVRHAEKNSRPTAARTSSTSHSRSWDEHNSFSGDFLRERAKRRPINLGQTRVAASPATFSVRSA